MKKIITISVIAIIILFSLFIIVKPSFTGQVINENKIKFGYCPTMQEEAIYLSEKNNYELIQFNSASGALFALKNKQIDKALIGRKAEQIEINSNIKETILKSGYTLVSKEKGFIGFYELPLIEVYTYLPNNPVPSLNLKSINKEEIQDKISEGKIVLISWDDWNDNFELIVVMDGIEKAKDFRGVFLYENLI